MLDPENGRIVDFNAAVPEALGYDREDLLGSALSDLDVGIDDHASLMKSASELTDDENLSVRGLFRTDDGESLPVDVNVERLSVGDGYLFFLAEVRSESSDIDSSLEYYRNLFEKAPIGLVELDGGNLYRTLTDSEGSDSPEDFLRSLSPDRLVRLISQLDIHEVNEKLLELVGAQNEEQFREELDQLPHPDSHDTVRSILKKFVGGSRHIEEETKIKTFRGAERWVRLIIDSIGPEDAFHSEVFVSVLDVTSSRRSQQKLRAREKSFRNLVSNVPGVVYRCDLDEDWTMRFISEDIEEITGYPAQEFLGEEGRSYKSVILEKDRDRVTETIENALAEADTFEVEYRLLNRDGDVRWVFERGRALRDEQGEAQYLEGVIQDVSERNEIQRRLHDSERRYRKLFENARVGMAELSFDEEWLNVNDELLEILGYQEEELVGSRCRDITHPDHVEEDERCARKLVKGETEYFTSEKRYQHRDGHWVWVRMTVSRVDIPRDGNEGYFVAIVEDVHQQRETERKLKRSERQFRTLFEQAAVGIAHVDLDGTMNRVNEKFADLMGYHVDELVGKTFQEITHDEDLENDLEKLERLKNGVTDSYELEKRYVRQDGSSFWAHLSVGAVHDEEGNLDYFVSVIKDITERKQAEKELRRSESRYRTTFEDAGIGMCHVRPDGRIIRTNQRLVDFLGYTQDELVDNSLEELVHPEDLPDIQRELDRLWSGEIDHFSLEQRYLRKDGQVVWADVNVGIPREGAPDEPSYMIGAIQNITRRKQIHQRQQTFFELSPDLMAIADFEGGFIEVNPAFESTLGYSAEELTSRPFMEFVHPEDREATAQELAELREGEILRGFENRYITCDDETRWLSWKATPGEDVIYAVARDVTARREFEERLRTMVSEKETLLKEVHHRVKNNLQVISSLLDMQRRRLSDQEVTEVLENSTRRVKSMALIHEQLYQSDQLTSIDLENYINDLIGHLRRVRSENREEVTVQLTVDENSLPLDQAIPCGLVLNELLSNALDHGRNPDGETVVDVRMRAWEGDRFRMVVQDNGPGFPDGKDVLGTESLGMEVVQSLVEYELNGTLELDNCDGARVSVTFPLDEDNEVTEN